MHSFARVAVVLSLSVAGAAVSAAAQTVRGTVVDEIARTPIAGATVRLIGADSAQVAAATSADDGTFTLPADDAGHYRIAAAATGYRASISPAVELTPGDTLRVEYRLSPDAVLLNPITVVAYSALPAGRLGGFETRRARGVAGTFITTADIERRSPIFPTDLFATVPGVQLIPLRSGVGNAVRIRNCVPQILLDGVRIVGGANDIDLLLSAADIAAIEVYRGPAEIPPELGAPSSSCGMIAIWTR